MAQPSATSPEALTPMPSVPQLIGSYHPPAVKRGERVACLYRDCECRVTAWTDAPILWPRVQPIGQRGGSGLWVNEVLVRAIRTESAAAMMHWFGVTTGVVWRWRKAFGVSGTATTKGSRLAHRAVTRRGNAAMKAKEWTDAERERKVEAAKRCGTRPGPRWTPSNGGWADDEVSLLGTDTDTVIAKKLGRSRQAVRSKRSKLKVPPFASWSCPQLPL